MKVENQESIVSVSTVSPFYHLRKFYMNSIVKKLRCVQEKFLIKT